MPMSSRRGQCDLTPLPLNSRVLGTRDNAAGSSEVLEAETQKLILEDQSKRSVPVVTQRERVPDLEVVRGYLAEINRSLSNKDRFRGKPASICSS